MSCPKGAEGPTPPKVKVNILGPQVFLEPQGDGLMRADWRMLLLSFFKKT